MSKIYHILICIIILNFVSCGKDTSTNEDNNKDTVIVMDDSPVHELVEIHTNWGSMTFWLYDETPLHKEHFLQMITDSFFNGQTFNRIVKNFVIQGGCPDTSAIGHNDYPVALEVDSAITHVYGALGMGRYGEDVNPEKLSNGCQIYIVSDTAGEHRLDMDYSVFGILVNGSKTLDSLNKVRTGLMDDYPKDTTVYMQVNTIEYSEQVLKDSFQFDLPKFN